MDSNNWKIQSLFLNNLLPLLDVMRIKTAGYADKVKVSVPGKLSNYI